MPFESRLKEFFLIYNPTHMIFFVVADFGWITKTITHKNKVPHFFKWSKQKCANNINKPQNWRTGGSQNFVSKHIVSKHL